MKGSLASNTVIALVIGIIVIAIALYFLSYADALDVFFFTDKTKLVSYATCSMAICTSGLGSAQVDKVGCLEREGGQCVKSCRQVAEEFYENRDDTFSGPDGRLHFCGEENALEFEFDSAIPVSIMSGEVQRLAKVKWACEGILAGDLTIGFSQNFQKSIGDCMMMYFFNFEPGVQNWANLLKPSPGNIGRECFDGFRNVMFTPLMPYSLTEDAIYPTGLYLEGDLQSGCEISSGGPVHTGVSANLASEDEPGKTLPTFSQCSIKAVDAEGKKKFRVWSEAVVNKPYLQGLFQEYKIEGEVQDPTTGIASFFAYLESTLKENYGKVNTCSLAILSTDGSIDGEQDVSFAEQQRLIAPDEQLHPAMVNFGDDLYLYFQDSNSVDVNKLTSSAIKSVGLADGRFDLANAQIVKGYDGSLYIQPSATVLNGHTYLAYASKPAGAGTWKVSVENLATGSVSEIPAPDNTNLLSPSLTSIGGKLYLAAYTQTSAVSSLEVVYAVGTVVGDGVDWEEYRAVTNLKGNGETVFPSISATPGGLMVAYSYRSLNAIDTQDEYYYSVGAEILGDGIWEDAGRVARGGLEDAVSEAHGSNKAVNNGFPHLFVSGGETLAFFDRGVGSDFGSENFHREIVYSRYLGDGTWSEPTLVSDNRAIMASAAEFKGMTVVAYSEYVADGFDLVIATEGGKSLVPEETQVSVPQVEIEVRPDKSSYSSGETVVFSGTLKIGGEPASGEEVRLELYQVLDMFGTQLKKGKNAETDDSGRFTWELPISAETTSTFEITANYQGKKSTYRFTVG